MTEGGKMIDKKSFMQAVLAPTKDIVSPPVPIVPFADWDYYYTTKILEWRASNGAGEGLAEVIVPPGFVTDLASIPPEFWSVLSPTARYSYPAIVHDYLYWFQTSTRAQADTIFKMAMEELGVSNAKIFVIYNAVRLAGESAWNSNAAARNAGEHRILKKFPQDVRTTWATWKTQLDVFVT